MTPGAQIAAAIDLLDQMDRPDAPPADKVLSDWNRANRYAGSKDRNAIASLFYAVLRYRGQLDWWIKRCQGGDGQNRHRMVIWLALGEGFSMEEIKPFFDGERYNPKPLTPAEERILIELSQEKLDKSCQPDMTQANAPLWLEENFKTVFGENIKEELSAFCEEAPVDLRVNTLKASKEEAKQALKEEGIETADCDYSPFGLRLERRRPLSGTKAFKDGLVEVQDEGSQLAAILADTKPGHKVVDFCAGAGGKSLAMGAAMNNTGRIIACDVSEGRLKRAAIRFKRAGLYMIERRTLTSERDKWVKRRSGRMDGGFDRVFVDAPCTGTGTWRRNPDQKWKLTQKDVEELAALQSSILDSACRLVVPGGRLIYVTCSILQEENEAQVERFLKENDNFFIHPIKDVWKDTLGSDCPTDKDYLRLTPHAHGTDGFFVAVMGRKL
ncbi:RsmB/NOP family class I SAM-dependent RNA methyltransferase [Curvivirga aplysinae]|uniref:RsmB/NOP family class I SAM-dependent RNA methyltransferase n=1 Tax=Curvivirga aplysinae TaxID=2529852 RepID=UPI0012BC0B67|nr:RsmB/NOP family class I SAM-dependent RNA methyltransferase [Curvivirga aplysinae]MTI10688.1 RsmB/NOP family class I SAM-dependent RNA methyltransferase [Curvivirga aplysinae]